MLNRIVRAVVAWGAINALLLAPIVCLLTTNVPHFALVTIKADRHLTIKVGGEDGSERVKGCNASPDAQTVKIYLPCVFDGSKMTVAAEGNETFELIDLKLRKRFLLERSYAYSCSGAGYICEPTGGFLLALPTKLMAALLVGELGLFVISFLATFIFKREKSWKKTLAFSFGAAALALGFISFVVPLQTYLSNTDLFKFGFGSFALDSIGFALIGTIVVGFGLFLASSCYGYYLHALVIAFVVFEYFQTGILSIGEPPLNGELTYYLNANLVRRELWVALGVFGLFALAYKWMREYLHWIMLAMVVMMCASILDVKKGTLSDNTGSFLSPGFCTKRDTAVSVTHSTKRNVMLIVLDSIGTKVFKEVIAEDPEMAERLSGFVGYANNIGVHNKTETSTAATMGGAMFDPDGKVSADEFRSAPVSTNSVLATYVRANIPSSAIFGSVLYGYSSYAKKSGEDAPQQQARPFFFRPDSIPPLNLFETTRFRLMPFVRKYELMLMTFIGTPSYASIVDESSLYPLLAAAPISDEIENNFETFHTNGAHSPFDVDKFGNGIDATWGWEGHYNKAYYVLHQVADLLDAYKRRGIYDNSFIILIADHGWFDHTMTSDKTLYLDRAKPMLLVKPIAAQGPMQFSTVPTSHLKLRSVLEAAATNDLSVAEVTGILRTHDRLFRFIDGYEYDEIVDYHFDEEGNVK